jgi:uncharacterized protein with FMN-binding domain
MQSSKYKIIKHINSIIWISVMVSVIIGFIISESNNQKLINRHIDGENVSKIENEIYKKDSTYFIFSTSLGYGGEITCLIETDSAIIKDLRIIKHSETQSYFKRCEKYILKFSTRRISDANSFPDVISGATLTCNGIKEAVIKSRYKLQGKPYESDSKIVFSKASPFLFLLIILSIITHFIKNRKLLKSINWMILIASLVVVGFWINKPLTITFFAQIIIFQPQSPFLNFDIYLIFTYALLTILFLKKNLYCKHICPFGAFQECCGVALKPSNKIAFGALYKTPLLLTGLALIPAFLYKAPGLASFEIYSGIFDFNLSAWLYILFIIVIVLMIFIKRPWCKLFCPTGAVLNFLLKTRIKLWKK